MLELKPKGIFRKDNFAPMVGDIAEVEYTADTCVISSIKPRKNSLIRPFISNIDILIIVASAGKPKPDVYSIDKLTVICELKNISPVIVISKNDVDDGMVDKLNEIYKNAGYDCVSVSAVTGDGIDKLEAYLQGKLCVFAGVSGVGKTSIIKTMCESDSLITGDISRKTGRGKHTTRHNEIFTTDSGIMIADTPGFSLVWTKEYGRILKNDLQHYFPEFKPFLNECKFNNCLHIKEKDCAVIKAVNDGEIGESRYKNYIRLLDEVKDIKHWQE